MWYEAHEKRWHDVLDVDVGELFDWAAGGPISFASRHPLHVDGNYNDIGWQHSALVGE